MTYCEFKLGVPIWDISDDEDGDSPAIRSLFNLLSITPPETSLDSLYDSFYDYSTAKYMGDPWGRIGRGDVLIFFSDTDVNTFIAIDMFNEATDQMSIIGIEVCASRDCMAEIKKILQSIRSSAEVASVLLAGNLGLREELTVNKFPRLVQNHDTEVLQHAQVFQGGKLTHDTRSRPNLRSGTDRRNKQNRNDNGGF